MRQLQHRDQAETRVFDVAAPGRADAVAQVLHDVYDDAVGTVPHDLQLLLNALDTSRAVNRRDCAPAPH